MEEAVVKQPRSIAEEAGHEHGKDRFPREYSIHEASTVSTEETQRAAESYMRSGLAVIPVPAGEKNPNRPGWQKERHRVQDIPQLWTNSQGIGVLWGAPSGGLVDVEFDWPEARIATKHILPPTRTFGRASAPESHRVYRSVGGIPRTKRYKVGGDGDDRSAVEVLSTGAQSLVPPSLHASGERRMWYQERTATEVDGEALMERVADVATAALIARNWPGRGARHDYALAATGYIGRRLPRDRAERIMQAAVEASGDEEAHGRLHDVADTLEELGKGGAVTGGPTLDTLAPGVVDQLRRWHRWVSVSGNDTNGMARNGAPTESLTSIVVNDRPLRDVSDDALRALRKRNEPPTLFARAGRVIRLGRDEHDAPIVQEASESVMRHHLTRAANFVHVRQLKSGREEVQVHPPRDVVQDVSSVPHLPFPPLIGVPRTPFFRPDGTIVDEPGYDAATQLYYVPTRERFAVEVPDLPTDDDLVAAVALLDEAVGDFPYVDAAAAANTLALLLSPILRNVISGPVPMALIDKPTPGTGGSLLAEVVSMIATGSPAGMMSAPRDDEEVRKQITSTLMRGNLVVTLDNVEGTLAAPSLSRALTSEFWEDRMLGRSEMIRVPQRATWVASGNNLQVGGDLPRRTYWIRLDARVERPWERAGFRHPNLKAWVAERREDLVSALLTMGRAWFVRGKPRPQDGGTIGGFEGWSHTVGGVLEVAGAVGFLDNLSEMYDRAADGSRDWAVFLEAWRQIYGAEARTTKQIGADLHDDKHTQLREALPDEFGIPDPERPDKSLSRRLGNTFNKREGRPYGERRLYLKRAGSRKNAKLWEVAEAPTGEGAKVSLVSLVSLSTPTPHARAGARVPSGRSNTNRTNGVTSGEQNNPGRWYGPAAKPAQTTPEQLLDDPPPWLTEQIVRYREDPDRMRATLCRAIAYKVLGDTDRWQEVVPILDKRVGPDPRPPGCEEEDL